MLTPSLLPWRAAGRFGRAGRQPRGRSRRNLLALHFYEGRATVSFGSESCLYEGRQLSR